MELTKVRAEIRFELGEHGGPLAIIEDGDGRQDMKTCYASMGQHDVCSRGYYLVGTRAATPEEAAPLLAELASIGYEVTEAKIDW